MLAPYYSGIAGGSAITVSDGGSVRFFDSRGAAPANATSLDMHGPLSPTIPGSLRAMEAIHKAYGRLPWRDLFAPSIALARDGFVVFAQLEFELTTVKDWILSTPALREIYAPRGELLKRGDVCRRPKYAEALQMIAEKGADEFYTGTVAKLMLEDLNMQGGKWQAK